MSKQYPVRAAAKLFLIFAAAYVISYALRSINAVIAPDLSRDLLLGPADLGLLASAYFLSFAVMQLPVGVLLDRFGPRRVNAILMLITALGCFCFAMATHFSALWCARFLIGIGVSACLMAALKAYAERFPGHLQASLSSWMLMAGSFGALTATLPVAWLLPSLGWRGVFMLVAVCSILAAAALWWGIDDAKHQAKPLPFKTLMAGFGEIYRHPRFWHVMPIACIYQGGFMAFQGLWLGPWLMKVEGLSSTDAASAIFAFSATLMLSYFLLGLLTRRIALRGGDEDVLMVWGVGLSLVVGAIQAIWPGVLGLPGWLLFAALASTIVMSYASANRLYSPALAGRSSTALNLFIFVGAFVLQWGFGAGVELGRSVGFEEIQAYQLAFTGLLVLKACSWFWLLHSRTSNNAR